MRLGSLGRRQHAGTDRPKQIDPVGKDRVNLFPVLEVDSRCCVCPRVKRTTAKNLIAGTTPAIETKMASGAVALGPVYDRVMDLEAHRNNGLLSARTVLPKNTRALTQ